VQRPEREHWIQRVACVRRIDKQWATRHDLSAQPRYAATWVL